MNVQMSKEKTAGRFVRLSLVFLIAPALLGRICRVVFSLVSSDVTVADTALPSILQYVSYVADAFLAGAVFALIPLAADLYGRKKGVLVWLLSVLAYAFFSLSGYLTDLVLGTIRDRESEAGLLTLTSFGISAAFAAVCLVLSLVLVRPGGAKIRSSLAGTLISCGVYFLVQGGLFASDILAFLDEVHYPNEAEVSSMIREGALTFLFTGVLVLGFALTVRALAGKIPEKTGKGETSR